MLLLDKYDTWCGPKCSPPMYYHNIGLVVVEELFISSTLDVKYRDVWQALLCTFPFGGHHFKTSFLLKRNGPNDLNKMISKVCGCKMGQGE